MKIDKKNIIILISVILLVILFTYLFMKIFAFENKKKNNKILIYPEVNQEYINNLYKYIDGYFVGNTSSMYSGTYTKNANLSYDIQLAMTYNYLFSEYNYKLKTTTNEEAISNGLKLDDKSNLLYKVTLDDMNEAYKKVFGKVNNIKPNSFNTNNVKAYYVKEKEIFYIYKTSELVLNKQIFKELDKYLITNNGNTIIIYDYYLKCDTENGNCYNDERLSSINNAYKYSASLKLDNKVVLKKYQHTFKFEDGYYYWYSSEASI